MSAKGTTELKSEASWGFVEFVEGVGVRRRMASGCDFSQDSDRLPRQRYDAFPFLKSKVVKKFLDPSIEKLVKGEIQFLAGGGQSHAHDAAVCGIGQALDVAALDERVHDMGCRAERDPQRLSQLAHRHRFGMSFEKSTDPIENENMMFAERFDAGAGIEFVQSRFRPGQIGGHRRAQVGIEADQFVPYPSQLVGVSGGCVFGHDIFKLRYFQFGSIIAPIREKSKMAGMPDSAAGPASVTWLMLAGNASPYNTEGSPLPLFGFIVSAWKCSHDRAFYFHMNISRFHILGFRKFGRIKVGLTGAVLGVLLLATLFQSAAPVHAASFTRFVATNGANNAATLCLLKTQPCRTIGFALGLALPGDTIRVRSGDYPEHLTVDKDITIVGAGITATLIRAGGGRVILVQKGITATISRLGICCGELTLGGGAGVKNEGTLTLDRTHIFSNTVIGSKTDPYGGGIWNEGTLTVKSSNIELNNAAVAGGGIYNKGKLVLKHSKLFLNTAGNGGGLDNENGGTATLTDDTVGSGISNLGGGVFNYFGGNVTLTRVLLINNSADMGGGLYNSELATLKDVKIADNTAKGLIGGGGGVANFGGVTLSRVTFDSNAASAHGGGLDMRAGNAVLTNVTFHFNDAPLGAGIFNGDEDYSNTALKNVTLDADSVGGSGIYNIAGTVTLKNTIVGSGSTFACFGAITSLGHNLGDGVCGLDHAKHDIIGVHPKLGAFGSWGGFTDTYPLLANSPAIDAGATKGCPSTDQRGIARPQDGDNDGTPVCDIGAFEQEAHHSSD